MASLPPDSPLSISLSLASVMGSGANVVIRSLIVTVYVVRNHPLAEKVESGSAEHLTL
jgi:hypothetical protein